MFSYEEKIVCITGAARGIGKQLVKSFLAAGATVIINYRRESDSLKEFLEELVAAGYQDKFLAVQADVCNENEVKEMFRIIKCKYSKIDVLINNAGITKDSMFMMMSTDNWDKVLDTNLKGTFLCCKSALWSMCKSKSGIILNLASVSGIRAATGQANYAASKAGVIMMTKVLAKEYGNYSIRINAIAPGFIDTDMTAELPVNIREEYLKNIPLKSFGKVEDVANAALFLCSDYAKYITGQCLEIDGGLTV